MHHFLSRPDWLSDVNDALIKRGSSIVLDFTNHFMQVENDWASGYEPEDVADRIVNGQHTYVRATGVLAETTSANG